MSWRDLLPDGSGIPCAFVIAANSVTAQTLNSSGDRAAVIVLIAKSGNIRKVRFRTGTVTTGDTLRVSLQNLNASGDPDGTPDQSQTVVVADGDDNVYKQVTLDADRTVAAGDLVAVVIDFSSYVAGNLGIFIATTTGEFPVGLAVPVYSDFYDGAAWTKTGSRAPVVILEYDDGTVAYQPGCTFINGAALSFSSSSTPDENGNLLVFDETTRVTGFELFIDSDGAYDVVLYDTDGTTALGTKTMDITARAANQTNKAAGFFSSKITCVGGQTYRLVIKPTTTTNTITYQHASDAAAAGDLNVLAGGSAWHKTSRTDAGAWTENTLRRVAIWPIIDAIDVPSGGGGMLVHPGMTGGMRG